MTDLQADAVRSHGPNRPGRRGALRTVGAIAAGAGVAVIIAALLAFLVLRYSAGAPQALQTLRDLRVWMIPAQIVILGLLWVHWLRVVDFIGWWHPMSPAAREAFIRDRKRIFLVLVAFEALIVLRALSS